MSVYRVQFCPWDKSYVATGEELTLNNNDQVVVRTDYGYDLATVVTAVNVIDEAPASSAGEQETITIIRSADDRDLANKQKANAGKMQAIIDCQAMIDQRALPMKLLDVDFSLDKDRVVCAFVAGVRVDFRDLLKDLNRYFSCQVRLQQVGARDQAKILGDNGPCGRGLCCRQSHRELSAVGAENLDGSVSGRGGDRLTGACGRLMCCLKFEGEAGGKAYKKPRPVKPQK